MGTSRAEHDHGSGHAHAPADFGRAFLIGIMLNLGFVAIEATYGILANSVALLADAGHNLSDVLGLVAAWAAATLAKRAASATYTHGLRRTTILAALFNAVFLLVAVGAIAFEAIGRLRAPEPVATSTVMAVATVGIVVNGITAWMFARGRKGDINIRGAFLHMAADAVVSAGVVVAALVVGLTGWTWLDPVTSLVIVVVILFGTWGLLRDSVGLSLDRVPDEIDHGEVEAALTTLPGVTRVHHVHIWPLSTTEAALTAHLVIPAGYPGDVFLHETNAMLHDRFEIGHVTLQIEQGECGKCAIKPAQVG